MRCGNSVAGEITIMYYQSLFFYFRKAHQNAWQHFDVEEKLSYTPISGSPVTFSDYRIDHMSTSLNVHE